MTEQTPLPGLPALPQFLTAPRFPPSSRYALTDSTQLEVPGRPAVTYLRRRFCPDPLTLAEVGTHVVAEGERLDHIAAAAFADPEQFWRLCDANRALDPRELVAAIGRRLRLTLPPGVPGPPDHD
jgi:hypothetical protein